MPRVSWFLGIGIYFHIGDHPPPHLHAEYGGKWGVFGLTPLRYEEEDLPPRIVRLVREWARAHGPELLRTGTSLDPGGRCGTSRRWSRVTPMSALLRVVVAAEPRQGHRVFLRFDDGAEGEVDLRQVVPEFKNLLAPLADPAYVAQVRADPQAGTVTWPNGVDLDPVVLYCALRGIPIPTFGEASLRRNPKTPTKRAQVRRSGARGASVRHRRTGT